MSDTDTIDKILERLQDTLASDEDIEAYCQEQFKKSPRVYLGTDPDNPPPDEDYPLVVLYAVPKSERGNVNRTKTHEIILGAGVWNKTVTRTEDMEAAENLTEAKKVTYAGFPQAERLRELAESAIMASLIMDKIEVGSETFPDVIFPIFRSDTKIELSVRVSTRSPGR